MPPSPVCMGSRKDQRQHCGFQIQGRNESLSCGKVSARVRKPLRDTHISPTAAVVLFGSNFSVPPIPTVMEIVAVLAAAASESNEMSDRYIFNSCPECEVRRDENNGKSESGQESRTLSGEVSLM